MSLVLKTLQGILGSRTADGRGINSFSIVKPWFWMQQAALNAMSEERGVIVVTRLPQALKDRVGLTTDVPEVGNRVLCGQWSVVLVRGHCQGQWAGRLQARCLPSCRYAQ